MKKNEYDKNLCRYYGRKDADYSKMLEIKNENQFKLYFLIDGVNDLYADTGYGTSDMNFKAEYHYAFGPLVNDDYDIDALEFRVEFRHQILTWVDIWRKMDRIVKNYNLDLYIFRDIKVRKYFESYSYVHLYPTLQPIWF